MIFGNGNAGVNAVQGICLGCVKMDVYITYVYKYGYAPQIENVKKIRFDEIHYDELSIVREANADIIFAAGWHKKLLDELIMDYDCFNIHPSLLPKYRGVLPIEFQLLNKEKYSGVTIHKMNDRFDAGPIYAQQVFSIENVRTVSEFVVLASRVTRKMIVDFINNYPNIEGVVQDETQATYYSERDRYLLKGSGLG
ncbi:formyltransferase family protein [Methanobrevibacter ruminantium]|uniref:formyltransferase family protein n=1 Tax=Methanobrevibacter ruminantium TaxID=83816 RepID=UPI0026F04D71|nr:formyltransferase family protein [Methanobrevibacter ruminantium]